MRKLQEGMNEPDFDSRFGGIEATGPKCLISEAGMAAVVCRALQVFFCECANFYRGRRPGSLRYCV